MRCWEVESLQFEIHLIPIWCWLVDPISVPHDALPIVPCPLFQFLFQLWKEHMIQLPNTNEWHMIAILAKRRSLAKNNYPTTLWTLFILLLIDTTQYTLSTCSIEWVCHNFSHLRCQLSGTRRWQTMGFPYHHTS